MEDFDAADNPENAPYLGYPDHLKEGHFGEYGGCYVPELLLPALKKLEQAFYACQRDQSFQQTFQTLLTQYAGRPTPLFKAENLSHFLGKNIFIKNEGTLHTGAHKLNNAIGQALLCQKMGKKKVIAETGAGQHGLAVATIAAKLNLSCKIFMGAEDIRRQYPNVFHIRQLGAEVVSVSEGSQTLKDAVNASMKYWIENLDDTHYIIGSALGPFPFPLIVREFQKIIGHEVKKQLRETGNESPQAIIACVGGGSNALGCFAAFLDDRETKLIGVEAGGKGVLLGQHASRFKKPQIAISQGYKSYFLQTDEGQIAPTHSISAGLDYAGVSPELAYHYDQKRIEFLTVSDEEALRGFQLFAQKEGIVLAMESSHAAGALLKHSESFTGKGPIVINASGRGDKDLFITARAIESEEWKNFLQSEWQRKT